METPKTLNDYFIVVDDLFRKTFRDDCTLFMALKTTQVTRGTMKPVEMSKEVDKEVEQSPFFRSNFMTLSPRMLFKKDGTTLGKVKVAFSVEVPHICDIEQKIIVDTEGAARADLVVRNIVDGLELKGRAVVNGIAPASQDVTAVNVHYQPSDFYGSVGYQRNGLGSSNLLVDCGATFVNVLLGGGFERQQVSFLEHEEGREQFDVMYAGMGFSGSNWSMGAKMTRTTDSWSSARLAILQKLTESTAMACSYNFDVAENKAHVTMGFMQGFRLRLPTFILPKRGTPLTHTEGIPPQTLIPLVIACKGTSEGLVSSTIRGFFNESVRWGVVMQKNLVNTDSGLKFGLTLTVEADS